MTRTYIPIDVTVPIACTATSDEIPIRIDQIDHMRGRLLSIERSEQGLVLHFPSDYDLDAHLQQFVTAEKGCCQFWGFEIERDTDLTLRWDGPADVQTFLDELLRYFQSDEPITAFSGLL